MKKFFVKIFFLLLIILGASGIWLQKISQTSIDPDEVVWVLDARFYEFRKNKNWPKFELKNKYELGGWSTDEFRLLDQPQLGKYWYGWLLDRKNILPWKENQTQYLYKQFSTMRLNTESIRNDAQYSLILDSIMWLRKAGSVVSFIAIILWGIGIYLFTKNKAVASLASLFLFFHPTLFLWYRLAVPNSLQILVTVSAWSLIFYLLGQIGQKRNNLDKKLIGGWVLAGVLAAASASIKLNGFFILLSPVFVWMFEEMKAYLFDQSVLQNFNLKLKSYLIFVAAFFITFFWLEPELWSHPLQGLVTLFQLRIDQQHRFLWSFENYSFFETWWFLLSQFLRVTELIWMKVVLFISLFWGGKTLIYRSLTESRWYQLAALLLFILVTNSFYANVGFDRYAEWSLFIFSFLAALGIDDLVKLIRSSCKKLV